jgi:FlaA1/EpsC-like NDP-sugar epimerase
VLLLFVGLLAGQRIWAGAWSVPSTFEWILAHSPVMGVHLLALYLGGAYTSLPPRTRLRNFIDLGGHLLGAWGLLFGVSSLVAHPALPPSSLLFVGGLVGVGGALGSRALLHRLLAPASPSADTSSPAVRLDDLVSRTPLQINSSALRSALSEQTVLVTGAGGSIGAELSAQLLALNPARLVLVDVSEHNLYQLERRLQSSGRDDPLEFCIADVRDETVMDGLMAREQPDLVFHTAAYKHVPLLERHPAEAFRNNTMATVHLLRLCEHHDVDQFVFVSTDKAVRPTSVLGATKQQAEWYVRTASNTLQSATVRFGNVFGSQGSVVPRFEAALAAGRPLPVTHPDMERYFMTSGEACRLLLHTLLLDTHPTYILRMGDPIRIQWLAERLIERWYPDVNPASMIKYVGRRPGEKLSEDLVQDEETVHSTSHPSILGLDAPAPYRRETLDAHFQHLQDLCDPVHGSREQLRKALLEAQPVAPSTL